MAIISGTPGDDTLIVNSDTTSVQADAGTDTAVFSGNYADYTFSQSDSYASLMTNNATNQVVSLYGVEQLQFDDGVASLSTTGSDEFQVNTYTPDWQSYPSTTALNDGGFVITWHSYNQDNSSYSIYAQRYDASGNNLGAEFQVNTYTSGVQNIPSTTALGDGGFVVTWMSDGQDGSSYGIFAQRYDASGNNFGTEFQVNTETYLYQQYPSITALNDGGFVITWMSHDQDGSYDGIFAQRYDASGNNFGTEFQVNTYTSYTQDSPSTTALADGGFVITWKSEGQNGSSGNYDIYAQRYDVNGNTAGIEFQVNTYTPDWQSNPDTAALADGGFVITWHGYGATDNSSYSIYAQRYDASGNNLGAEFQVNTYTSSNQSFPSTTALADGGFVITWQSDGQDGSNYGIYAQRYDASGNNLGAEFQANTYTSYTQEHPSTTALADGGFVITWHGYGSTDNSYYGIYAQRYDASDNPLGPNTLTFDAAPTIVTPIANTSTNEDAAYSYDASANFTDADVNDVLTYSATLADGSALPGWLSMDSTTGIISGTPLNGDVGSINVTVTATGISGISVSDGYTLTVEDTRDAIIYTIDNMLLDNLSLLYIKDGIDTGVSTLVKQGGINIEQNIEFDSITLSVNDAYADDLNIMDMYGVLGNIGQIIDTSAEHAADTNNDGIINIMDMYAVLNSIGQTSQSFDLVDQNGNLVTSLNSNSVDTANWNIIANGDVDQSGGFVDAYVMQVDIV
jgi:hypothetical protein